MKPEGLAARGVRETRVQVRRWFVETGWTDGNGIGLWDHTDESVEVASKAEAEALRDEWLSQGKIELDRWNQWKRIGSYGAFRIRSVWEDADPAALAASPTVQAMMQEAEARGWNAGMLTAESHVAEARNGHEPGPLVKALNKALRKIADARHAAALKGEKP